MDGISNFFLYVCGIMISVSVSISISISIEDHPYIQVKVQILKLHLFPETPVLCGTAIHLSVSARKLSLLSFDSFVTIIVNIHDNTTERTTRVGSHDNILDAYNVAAMADPVEGDVSENIDEANEGNDI